MIETLWSMKLRFDRIHRKAKRAKRRVMSRGGAIIRTIMRRSIRYRKKKNSEEGSPPFSHVPSSAFGLRKILWFFDPSDETTIIGPIGGSENTGGPRALEFGESSEVKLPPRLRKKLGKATIRTRIGKREYAYPALKKFSSEYPELWEGAIS